MISQDPFLFSATRAREHHLRRARISTTREVERIARLAQAHEFVEQLPDGYDTIIGERGITLSGGQRQRLAIARALAVDPRILILDDATASVDATTEARIRLGLREAMRDRTTLIIAHRLSTIALADEIVVLDEGRIARPRYVTTSCSRRARSTATSTSTACSSASSPTRSRRGRATSAGGGIVIHAFGPKSTQTRAPRAGIVAREGGGSVPTLELGGGALEGLAARAAT